MRVVNNPNPENDFFETVAFYPFEVEALFDLGFPSVAIECAVNFQKYVETLLHRISIFKDLSEFVEEQVNAQKIALIKIHNDGQRLYAGKMAIYYLCFGGHPSETAHTISFRIDQDWHEFDFPQDLSQETKSFLETDLPCLSGLIVGRLDYPPVIFDQYHLNKTNQDRIDQNAPFKPNCHFYIACDYWGTVTGINNDGKISQLLNIRGKRVIRETGMLYRQWIEAELQSPFRQRFDPNYIEVTNGLATTQAKFFHPESRMEEFSHAGPSKISTYPSTDLSGIGKVDMSSLLLRTSKNLKLLMTPTEYQAFREQYKTKSGSYETIHGKNDPSVWEYFPEYLLARCPLCGAIYTDRMDTYSLQHWLLGVTDVVYSTEKRFVGCRHYAGVTSFIHLHGKMPNEIEYFQFKPEVPYVIPDYLPDSPISYAVIHSLPLCRTENNVFVPAYSLFVVTYYSESPSLLHSRSIQGREFEGPIFRPHTFKVDWDLLPWVAAGKLCWLDLDQNNLPLKSMSVEKFPYARIEGRQECFNFRRGVFEKNYAPW